jgi:hypothetical protein
VFLPPRMVVLPAKPFTRTVNKKAMMFNHFRRAELVAAIHILPEIISSFKYIKAMGTQNFDARDED